MGMRVRRTGPPNILGLGVLIGLLLIAQQWVGSGVMLPGSGMLLGSGRLSEPAALEPAERIRIDIDKRSLTLYRGTEQIVRYSVAVGKPSTPSPIGEWKVVSRSTGVGGAFGSRWLGLNVPWGTYGIHGTNQPGSIGWMASAGCIRMNNRNIEELFPLVPMGTPVTIVGQRRFSAFRPVFRSGSSGQDVVYLQMRLRELGFGTGPADGRFGAGTVEAVRNLQAFYGLKIDGVVNLNVLHLLNLK